MTVKYKTVITKAGAEKLAAATVPNGKKVNFTAMAVGDGGGTLPTPNANQTKLVREVWRHTLNKISQDNKNKNYVVAELVIPPETGGFWLREMGLYDDTGTLIAVGNMAESYKPELAEGSGRAQTLRMVIMVSDIESVELAIDTTLVMATQDYVDDKLAEHEQSRRHPDASLTAKGFTQLSNATDSTSEVLAATPKAVKVAYDLAKAKYTAQDATTAQKGIVQLSSATDSTSEVLAATPKAVKAVSDELALVKKSLGTASGEDVVTSSTDTTEGRLPVVGWQGLGAQSGPGYTDANTPNVNCFFRMNAEGIHGPVAGAPSNILQFQYDINAGQQIGYRAGAANAPMQHRTKVNAVWGNWAQVFDTLNPPSASQVDAVSASKGGTFAGAVTFNGALTTKSAVEIYGVTPYIDFHFNNSTADFTSRISEESSGTLKVSGNFVVGGTITPGSYTNFDGRFYTKTLADNLFQAKGSYGKPETSGDSGGVLWTKNNDTGVICMMGKTANVSNSGRVTFPFAFPSECRGVIPTRNNETGNGAAMQPYGESVTGWNLRIAGGGTETVMWFAMGK